MINVQEAHQLIRSKCNAHRIVEIDLLEANLQILAESVIAAMDTPPFDQSAMDGYAFAFDKTGDSNALKLTGEIQAGTYSTALLSNGETVRIYTGAPLPTGADTVVVQENVELACDYVKLVDALLVKGGNVRKQGSQGKKGDVILDKGQILTPAGISLLAGNGLTEVKIYGNPVVHIINTGKELVKPGETIRLGEIYESNSFGLAAALAQLGIKPGQISAVDDEEDIILDCIHKNLKADILILTGGVSVGDYDLVAHALERAGVKKIFHKVKQKPGKPFYFGVFNQTLVFGLPGNPAAMLTCFYTYIVPAIEAFTKKTYFRKIQLPLASDYKKKAGLTHFLKGKIVGDAVMILDGQESYLMNSFALADCILELEEQKEIFLKGELMTLRLII
jgi:molybdopterin molybdotransferase